MKVKKSDTKRAKDKAWAAFSLYIRTRDSLLTTGGIDECICVTCGNKYPRTGPGCIQAGHFLAGRHGSVLFSEEGCNGQCYGCNVGRNGNYAAYTLWMVDTYGRSRVDELIIESHQVVKRKAWDYQALEELYKAKTDALCAGEEVPQPGQYADGSPVVL